MRTSRRVRPKREGINIGEACDNLVKLERTVIIRTVKIGHTSQELMNCFITQENQNILRAAFPLVDRHRQGIYWNISIQPHVDIGFNIRGMLSPGLRAIDGSQLPPHIQETLEKIIAIHDRFQVAHEIVHWLSQNATLGAARNYFPSLLALLPAHHPIHSTGGEGFREPNGIGAWLSRIRESAGTIASAMLLAPPEPLDAIVTITLTRHMRGTVSVPFCSDLD